MDLAVAEDVLAGLQLRAVVAKTRGDGRQRGGRCPQNCLVGECGRQCSRSHDAIALDADQVTRRNTIEEMRVDRTRDKVRMLKDAHKQRTVGRDSLHTAAAQGAAEPCRRLLTRRTVSDDLCQHGVIVSRHNIARDHPAVETHTIVERHVKHVDPARCGKEVIRRVLRVQTNLDRVTLQYRVERLRGQRLPGGDVDLQTNKVQPGDELRDGVLNLEARVDLEEEEATVGSEQELDGARTEVAQRLAGVNRRCAHRGPQLGCHRRRWRLFDDLLVTALDRALTLVEVHDRALRVAKDLNFHVPWFVDVVLEEDGVVAERGPSLATGRGDRLEQSLWLAHDAHAAATSTERRLDQDRPADVVCECEDLVVLDPREVNAREHRDARALHHVARGQLGAHEFDRLNTRADEGDVVRGALAGELRVLGQEAVAGVDRVGADETRRCEHEICPQIGLRGRRTTQRHRLVRLQHEGRGGVRIGIDRDGRDAHLATGAEHASSDLATVGDQNLLDHVCSLTCGTLRSRVFR